MKILNILLPTIAVAFLAFLGGTYVMHTGMFPADALSNAYKGGQALLDQKTNYAHPFYSRFHMDKRTDARGVTIQQEAKAQPGYTLYTSGHDQRVFLIDLNGDVVHEWYLPFSAIWQPEAPVKKPVPDSHISLAAVHMFEDGDLLAVYSASGDTPWGYGLVRMDKDSKPVWTFLDQAHHDVHVGPDGRIYVLTHEINNNVIEQWTHLKPPRIDDYVIVLSPDGEELQKVSILDALVNSPYGRLLTRQAWYLAGSGDYLHTNSIDVITEANAKVFPHGKEGDVLLSMRELGSGALAVLDLDAQQVTWATEGTFAGQHDPDILENGNILLFDNRGEFGPNGSARVIELDPKTMGIVWSYSGTTDHPFESVLRSSQERQPNGNTVIVESDGGRIFEVTPTKEIVWEYINPVRGGDADQYIPIVSGGQRINPQTLDQAFRDSLADKNEIARTE